MKTITAKEMQLADVVTRSGNHEPFNTMTVKQITDREVVLDRPYGATADFSYTGGVLTYVGIEEVRIPLDEARDWELHRRKTLR